VALFTTELISGDLAKTPFKKPIDFRAREPEVLKC